MFEQCDNHRQPTDLVMTVKTAKEPNKRIKSDLDMSHSDREESPDQQGKLDIRIDTTGIRL